MKSQLRVQREFSVESLEALTEQWNRLDESTFPRTPFSGPTWNMLWWKHYRQNSAIGRDRLFVHSLWDQDGELRAVAPLMLTEQPSVGPLRFRRVQFFGADANVTEIRGIVCARNHEESALTALIDDLLSRAKEWDFASWKGLHSEPGVEALMRTRNMIPGVRFPDYYLEPGGEFRANLPRNIKESLRKCYNSLKRDKHDFELRVIEDAADVSGAVETFFRLHGSRAALSGTITHKDVFASERARAFLLDFVRASATEGRARIFQLIIAGEVVATRIGFALGDHLYLYFSGYLPEWGKYSVMTTTVSEILQYAQRSGFTTVNLSPGNDVSKTRWRPLEETLQAATLVSATWRGPVAYRAYRALEETGNSERFSHLFKLVRRQV